MNKGQLTGENAVIKQLTDSINYIKDLFLTFRDEPLSEDDRIVKRIVCRQYINTLEFAIKSFSEFGSKYQQQIDNTLDTIKLVNKELEKEDLKDLGA